MSAEVTELRNPRTPSRGFRMIRKVRVPMAKWVKDRKGVSLSLSLPHGKMGEGKKRFLSLSLCDELDTIFIQQLNQLQAS
jgi:hypothetical protein